MQVIKRGGEQVPFDLEKIAVAIEKAFLSLEKPGSDAQFKRASQDLANQVRHRLGNKTNIDIEEIQNLVEDVLMSSDRHDVAKAYILYREHQKELRDQHQVKSTKILNRVTQELQTLAKQSSKCFDNDPLREFVYIRTYSRWIPELGRREMWPETVQRYMNFIKGKCGDKLPEQTYKYIHDAVLNMEVMPSMRLAQFAGPAAERCNVCVYNCSYSAPETFKDLADIMYLSMSGTGCGFSCEQTNVSKFPEIQPEKPNTVFEYEIEDSKIGWCDALQFCLEKSFEGAKVDFDYSHLRPKGARLKTSGGRSSGPEPLKNLLKFVYEIVKTRRDGGHKKLSTLNVHDIICKIGECVVSGGVRRTALLSISDLDDHDMRDCKTGNIWLNNAQRYLSNNSAAYNVKPSQVEFMEEFLALAKSGTGERGIFNRSGLKDVLPSRRVEFLGDRISTLGGNPCLEILLQPFQFCNLTEVVCRPDDTKETLLRKISIATVMGTIQSSFSDFKYIDPKWKKNQDDERLLGVSLTGIHDCPALNEKGILERLKNQAISVNREHAEFLGINPSHAITTIKPSGSVSQLVNASSGIHARFSKYYIRRIRISADDPLLAMMKAQGYQAKPEVGQTEENAKTFVLEFPVKSPEGCKTVNDISTIEQLEHWKRYRQEYVEHSISITIYVKPHEWLETAKFVWDNWEFVTGLSFLPYSDHVYDLAPYEAITEEQYEKMVKNQKRPNFAELVNFEREDHTEVQKTVACAGGNSCEL